MKQFKPMEPDEMRVYLQGHLRDHKFPEYYNSDFIETRTNEAYEAFTKYRLEGRSVDVAQELAMRVLLNGYYVSRWDVIYNLLEELFHNDLPEEGDKLKWAEMFLNLRFINKILDKYEVNGDFLSREDYPKLQNELAGTIADILEQYRNELQ